MPGAFHCSHPGEALVNLLRWLQLTTATLAVLGASFLVLTGDQTWFPLALGGSALIALVVTDWYGWVKVPRGLGNLAALISVAWTFREFMRLARDREAQLLTISHMLIYLQVVLVFQFKSRRVHWQLLVLSVLQVVVAAALAMGPQFGMLLIVYMATAIASMILLCYQREVVDEDAPVLATKSPVSLHRLLDPPRLQSTAATQQQLEHWVSAPWLAQCVLMFTLGSAAFTFVFFFSAPRLSDAVWQSARSRSSVSGFSGDVVLQTSGNIKLSEHPVMRVSFLNPASGRAMQLASEPYFHGQVLTHYQQNEHGARWSQRDTVGLTRAMHVVEEARPGDLVKQEIVLEAVQSRLLFAMMPVKTLPETPTWVDEKRRNPRLLRSGNEEQLNLLRELRYTIGTLAISNGRQLPGVPHFVPGKSLDDSDEFHKELDHHLGFDPQAFAKLKQAADEVIRSQQLENESQLVRAIALRNHLFSSGKFQYSLRFEAPPPGEGEPILDPLEHFISVGRKGHCELFASALVMMLRSQGIPARLVVGYKGGDWNAVGHYYLVRQKHAHAWVEALLTADQVPLEEIAGRPSGSGAWYRLDPTPPSFEELAAVDKANLQSRVQDIFDYADYMWREYVLGLNAGRQETMLEPLASRSRDMIPGALDASAWQRWLRKSWKTPPPGEMAASSTASPATVPWVSYAALLGVVIAAPAGVAGLLLLTRWLWQHRKVRRSAAVTSTPEFFVELTRLLARRGIKVPRNVTAGELANLAAARLAIPGNATRSPDLTAVLDQIVACYHRVRFGGVPLSRHEQTVVSQALALLKQARVRHPSSKH